MMSRTGEATLIVSQEARKLASSRLIIALHLLISTGAILAAILVASDAFAAPTSIRLECLILSSEAVWLVWSWRTAAGGFFNPYGLFLGAALLFNAGQAFMEIFGWNSEGLL